MSSALTVPALREVIYAALTSPPLPYNVDNGGSYGTTTLPSGNVKPRSVWLNGPNPPSPMVCFAVNSRGQRSRYVDPNLRVYVWAVADDELTAIYLYAGVRARLHLADDTGGGGPTFAPPSLSRVQTSAQLGVVVRQCEEDDAMPAEFDKDTGRWYVSAQYKIVAR